MNKRISYICSDGNSIVVENYPYLLQNFDPNYAPVTIMSDQQFNQDGENYYGSLLQSRSINFDVVVRGNDEEDLVSKCEELLEVFNPKRGLGTLVYDNGYSKRQIFASISYGPKEVDMLENNTRRKYNIGLYCPISSWEKFERSVLKMVGFLGGNSFPITFPMSFAIQGDQVKIDYDRSLSAPLLIEFRGPATLPKIVKKETGEFIEVKLEITSGEKLYIDTKPSAINVYKEDTEGNITSAFNYINHLTSYFQLTKGENTLTFDAVAGDPEVYLYYREQYIGVV